jgi:hypothetical protein
VTAGSRLLARLVALAAVAVLAAAPSATAPSAVAASRWAPESRATIKPGVQMYTLGAQCTANFVFTDRLGRVYVGYAAHCASRGSSTDTNGCRTRSHPTGTVVRFARGATLLGPGRTVGYGRLAYSSWISMRRRGVRNAAACANNDFALVRVLPVSVPRVNPTVPGWGGPVGLDTDGVPAGSRVYSYGASSLSPTGVTQRRGTHLGQSARGWHHDVYQVPPGVPGDSGAGLLDAQGRAFGTLSTVAVAPLPGSNGVGDLLRELRYAQRWSGIAGLRLVRGTRSFRS